MGKDLFDNGDEARRIFERADSVLGFSLSEICFEGTEEQLRRTEITQPALFVHSAAVLAQLQEKPSIAAGHSLGEFTALYAAEVLSFDDALRLVRLRGELMQQCGERLPGTMAAIVGMDEHAVDEICAESTTVGIVQAANYNSPGQVVISGSMDGVHAAMQLAKQRGARLVKELNVSGAFHSPLMQFAQQGLKNAVDSANFSDAAIPIVANVSAETVSKADDIKQLLIKQLTQPVRWVETIQNMTAQGVDTFIEIGPGNVLQGLVKRIAPNATIQGIEKWTEIQNRAASRSYSSAMMESRSSSTA